MLQHSWKINISKILSWTKNSVFFSVSSLPGGKVSMWWNFWKIHVDVTNQSVLIVGEIQACTCFLLSRSFFFVNFNLISEDPSRQKNDRICKNPAASAYLTGFPGHHYAILDLVEKMLKRIGRGCAWTCGELRWLEDYLKVRVCLKFKHRTWKWYLSGN